MNSIQGKFCLRQNDLVAPSTGFMSRIVFTTLMTLLASSSFAINLYWDTNGPTAGAGGATPTGTWGTDNFWTATAAGTTAVVGWTNGETAVFSAGTDASGTFTVNVSGTQAAAGISVEEGNLTLSGGGIALSSGAAISVSPTRNLTIGSIISGGAWSKTGGGALALNGANTFSGPLTITGSAVRFNHDSSAGLGSIIVSPASDVFLQTSIGSITLTNPITLNAAQNVDVSALSGTLTLNGEVSGGRSLWTVGVQGTNTVVLGGNNTFSGNVRVNAGSLIVTRDNALGTVGGTTEVSPGATLGFQGGLTYNAAEVIKLHGDGVGGMGAIQNISGSNLFFGPIDLQTSVTLGAAAGRLDLGGTISGPGLNLTKVGAGRIIVSGLGNNFAATTVSVGTLQVESTLGSGTVTVNSGAVLAGNGVVSGAVLLSGELSPAASPGTLTTGTETWNPGASYLWEINEADFGIAGDSIGWDLADINGVLNINATTGSKFKIKIASLDSDTAEPGEADDFDNTTDYSFPIATTTGGIIGFDPAKFQIDTASFSNALGFGIFVVETNATDLFLSFVHPPFIVSQPASISKQCGVDNASFTVVAGGTPTLSYQWLSNGVPIINSGRVSGAATATLSISLVELGDAASYSCAIVNDYGVTNTVAAVLTVTDTIAPAITCPATVTVNADAGQCYATAVALGFPTVADSCDAAPTITNNTLVQFPVGTNLVIWGATDGSGNHSECAQTVIVVDNQQPIVVVTASTNALDVNGNYTLTAADIAAITAGSSDNCGLASTNLSQTVFNFCHVGINNVTVTLTDIHSNAASAVVAITITAPPTPTVVYVDDDYPATCAAVNFPSNGVPGPYYVGFNAFKTIQAGIDAVAAGGAVNVAAGLYVEDLNVNKAVSLIGPNAVINPNTGVRVAEAVVVPFSSDPDPFSFTAEIIAYVTEDNVTIKGFTFDGDNTNSLSGVLVGTADVDASEAIASYEGIGSVAVANNIIKNISYSGLDFYNYNNSGGATTDNQIQDNKLTNIGHIPYGYGIGILIYNNFYAEISGNVMTDVRVGVQTGNFYQSNPGTTASISDNTISSSKKGVFYNLHYSAASPFVISNNLISVDDEIGASRWDGIMLSSQQSSVGVTVVNNTIIATPVTQTTVGYQLWNDSTTLGITITGGSVSGAGYGIWANNYDGYGPSNGDSTLVTLSGVMITNATLAGVYVKDNSLNSNGATVQANLNGVVIANSTLGLLVDGTDASLAPGDATLVNLSGDYIDLVNASSSNMDATSVSFDGLTGAGMSPAQLFATEDRIDHATDTAGLGLVRVKAANVYVTVNSGSIQRGINPASSGDVVNVNDGTYPESLNVNKPLSLVSANGPSVTTIAGASTTAVVFTADNIALNGFTISNPNGKWGLFATDHSNLLIANNRVVDIGVLENATSHNGGIAIESVAAAVANVQIVNNVVSNVYAGNNLGNKTAHGIVAGFSPGTQDITGLVVASNRIHQIASQLRGAYGIQINHTTSPGGGKTVAPQIYNNEISGLTGNWAHAIGLEGNTPNAVVRSNLISDLSDFNPTPFADAIGVKVEDNAYAASVVIQHNSFSNLFAGVLNATVATVNAESNWWASASGPVATLNPGGTGVAASALVDFSPWLGDGSDNAAWVGFQPNLNLGYYQPDHLVFFVQPGNAALSAPLSAQPVVHVIDENGGIATQFNGSVNLTIGFNPGGGVLTGTAIVPVVGGVATFTGLSISVGGGEDFTLVASTASPVLPATSTTFDIGNPVPSITNLNPFWKRAGDPTFVLTVTGADFVPLSEVLWNGVPRVTTYVNPTTVTASIPATDIALVGTAAVTVSNPPTAGGVSGPLTFRIEIAKPPIVYVDDDYTNNVADDLVNFPDNGGIGTHIIGYDAFATLQGGITAVTNTGTEHVAMGTYNEDVNLNQTVSVLGGFGGESIVVGPIGGAGSTFTFASTGSVLDGVTITRAGNNLTDWNNPGLNTAGVAMQGAVNGTVQNCLITGMRTAIDINNSGNSYILNNIITNNRTGMILRNQTDNLVVAGNSINDNWTVGVLFLDGSGGTDSPVQRANNSSFTSNSISGNWYGQIVDRQSGGSLPAPGTFVKNFSGNWLGTASPVVAITNSAEPGYAGLIPVIFGGSAVAPSGVATILGAASGNIDYTPWLDVGTDTSLAIGFQGNFATLHVDDSSPQAGGVTRIQEGVNMVSGSTVLVAAGNYSENVTITNKVTIDGTGSGIGAGDSIVTAANSSLPVFLVTDAGGLNAGDRLTIKDLRVTGGSDGVRVNAATGLHQWYRFDNLAAVNNAGSGIALTGAATLGEVQVAGSILSNNDVYGLQVADTLTAFVSLSVSGGSMDNNGANGLAINGTDANLSSPTQIAVSGTSFANNGNIVDNGTGDLSFYLFNGTAMITNVTILADGHYPIQFRGKGTSSPGSWSALGGVRMENVTVSGNTVRPGLYLIRYSDVSNVSFGNVDLSGLVPPSLPSGFGAVMQVEHSGVTPLNLAGLKLKTTYTGGPPAGYAALFMLSSGGAVADCSTEIVGASTVQELEASVVDTQDFPGLGDVTFPVLTLTPAAPNVIAECTGGGAALVTFALPSVVADCLPAAVPVCTPPSGSSFPLGTNTVTCVVTDNRGISATTNFAVIVLDTTAPDLISCAPSTNVIADGSCMGTVPDLTGLVAATDGCGSGTLVVTQLPTAGSLIGWGTNQITLTVTDPSGNSTNCITTVIVVDLAAPVVTTWPTNRTLSVGAGCELSVPDLTVEVVAADNCSSTTVTQSPLAGTVVSYGTTSVTVTVADQYGNATNNNTVLTIVDTTDPVITCPANLVVNRLDATDPYATGFATASDNCTNVTVTYNDNRSGLTNCNATGIIYRTWTATDGASNAITCVQTITITDTVAPLFTATQTNITTTNVTGLCSAVVNFPTPTAIDVGYNQGFESVAWVSGGYITQPSVDWNDYSSAMARVPSGTDGITSKSGGAHAVINSTTIPGNPFDYTGVFGRLGGYSSVFGSGFRSSVDVYLDLSNPAVTADTYGWDVSTAASGQDGAHRRDFIFHAASDAGGNILIAADNNTGFTKRNDLGSINHYTVTNSGWYTLEWVFRDNAGVLAVDCNLRDAAGALLWSETRSDLSDLIATVVGGNRYMWFTFLEVDKLAIDNAHLERNASVVCTPGSGSSFPVGTNEVTCVASDACGNTTTNTFTVVVNDVENPTITCPVDLAQNADSGFCYATVVLGTPAIADNCGIGSVTNDAVSQTQFPVGTNVVVWTVTDVHGNSATCSQTVIVLDVQPPSVACPANINTVADPGFCYATVSLGTPVVGDNCGVASITNNAASQTQFPVGSTSVTWLVTDLHGNTNTCLQTVTVLDTQPPQLVAGSIASCYETPALAEAAALGATGATDNCGVTNVVAITAGTCSATVTVTAVDQSGNTNAITYSTRIDPTAPTIGLITATEVQLGGPVNVKNNDCLTNAVVQGVVQIAVTASDNCSFVGGQPSVTLVNGTNSEIATFIIESPAGTYNYAWIVTNATANGTWTALVAASDICHTTTTNFTLCVNKTQVTGLVQLEGFNGNGTNVNHTRLVTFVATGGLTNKTWNLSLTNTSGDTFSYKLTDVPSGTTGVSAKTVWNLREKLAVTLDINGQAAADFTGNPLDGWSDAVDHYLRGGDISASFVDPIPRDNQVQLFDYSALGNNFFTVNPIADITGDGQVDYDDFFILYLNWFWAGDPQ